MLVGVLGKKRHGKDTISDHLIQMHNFVPITLAEPLKEACRALFGFTDEQLYGDLKEDIDSYWNVSPRTVFQFIGTDVFRKQIDQILPDVGDKFWVVLIKKKILDIQKDNPNANIVVTDVRFKNEVDMIKSLGGIIIKVDRPSINLFDSHISEKEIDMIDNYDKLIVNDKEIVDLHNRVDEFMNSL